MAAPFNPKACLRVLAASHQIEDAAAGKTLRWFRNNYERVYLDPALPEDKIPKKAAVLFNELLKQENAAKEYEKQKAQTKHLPKPSKPDDDDEKLTVQELLARGPMYPVPEEVKSVLYEGISHDNEGRKLYLKLRNRQNVRIEEKFYNPITTTFDYGWKVQERYIPVKRFGKKAIIQSSFNRGNGALKFDSPLWKNPLSNSISIN